MMIRFSKKMLSKFYIITVIVFFVLLVYSCTKLDTTSLGGNLIPGSDKLATDTLQLSVETTSFIENDTTVIDKNDQHVLGFINDPIFGTTTAAAYFQMLPTFYPFSYPVRKDSLFLDSVVLSLGFIGAYGDTGALSKVSVYKITDPTFKSVKRYKVNESINYSSADFLGTKTFKSTDLRNGYKLAYKTDSVFNQLRIKLDNTFGRLLLDQDNITGAFRNDSIFKAFLNGLVVVPDSLTSGNIINYFSLASINSRVNIYYRYTKRTGGLDTTVTNLTFLADSIRSASANKIHRNYNGSISQPYLTSGTPSSLAFLQTAPGTAVKIKAPKLTSLIGKKYIIHRAEIVVRQIFQGPVNIERILLQPTLNLVTIGADGKSASIPFDSSGYFLPPSNFDFTRNVFLADLSNISSQNYTGGTPTFFNNGTGNTVAEYRLNISRYVQNIINGKATLRDFKLEAPYFANYGFSPYNISSAASINPVAYGRVQVGGGTHTQYPMFVRIYYSAQ